ncbi:MAG TPA: hypothetical protein ENJ52_01200 [Aliiroseovarius sp.]|nr:hypothetical protein [Aliiroseovarius sp.]
MNFLRKFVTLAVLAAAGSGLTPAVASETPGQLDLVTVAACLDVPDSRATLAGALAGLGWQPVLPADLDDTALEGLALYFTSQHVFDAAPDMRLSSAWERARTNARGLTRLAPTPGSPSYFTSPGGSVLRVTLQQDQWLMGLYCTMILSPGDMARSLDGVAPLVGMPLADLPPFKSLPEEATRDDTGRRSFRLTLVNASELAEKIGTNPPFAGIVETALETAPQPGISQ